MDPNSNVSLYQGHSIFRNQPPYTYFNKCFDDPTDALFIELNEIDRQYLTEKEMKNNAGFRNSPLIDPRTQQEVKQTTYDHSVKWKSKIFRGSGVRSSLTKAEHVTCVRVLKAWQEQTEVQEEDILTWRQLTSKRLKEKQNMLKFLYDYAQTHREQIYAPAKQLIELYQKWYRERTRDLIQAHPENVAYNTHTGLPHVRVCKSETISDMRVSNVELLARKGFVPIWNENYAKDSDKINNQMVNLTEFNMETVEINLDEEIADHVNETYQDNNIIHLPLETLIFLVTAGEYIDVSTEAMLRIEEQTDNTKYIHFELPLPARHCGWHTHRQMIEQSYAAHLSSAPKVQWLQFDGDEVKLELKEKITEIDAKMTEEPRLYQLVTCEEYMIRQQQQQFPDQQQPKVKSNKALVKWELESVAEVEHSSPLIILTTLELPPALNLEGTTFLGSHSIKLEYKPQFGCEVMTKWELLREWFRLTFAKSNVDGCCMHLAIGTFEQQLLQRTSLPYIEKQLAEIYHINMQHLLANLHEFLLLLLKMPVGQYLLRYNAKYTDKMLLCAPSQEVTQHTIHLHTLFNTQPNDLIFMTEPQFLPIADDLCSVVHLQHKVLPCAFLPLLPHQQAKHLRKRPTLLNDRDAVLKRVQCKLDELKSKRNAVSKERKARKRKRAKLRKTEKQREQKEDEKLQKEIEMDQLFFIP